MFNYFVLRSAVDDTKTIKQIDRILSIWKEREIFGKDFIDKLQSYRPKAVGGEPQESDLVDTSVTSPKKRIRSTSDSGKLESYCKYFWSYQNCRHSYYIGNVKTYKICIKCHCHIQSSVSFERVVQLADDARPSVVTYWLASAVHVDGWTPWKKITI